MAVAVSMAKYLGATKLAVPGAGNAGGASPRTPLGPVSKRTSSCRETLRVPTSSSAASLERKSRSLTASSPSAARKLPGAKTPKAGSICRRSRNGIASREKIGWARFYGAHFIAPHFNTRANLVADLTCAGQARFVCPPERGRIWKTPVQSLGHASKDGTTLRNCSRRRP
jgi:hypothetical protein